MESASVHHVCEAWWTEVCKKMKNAVVFIDNISAESLHWNGGLTRLVKAGAKDVKEFSSFERGNQFDQKAIFLISSTLRDISYNILRDIVKASKFQYCVVITSAHPSVLAYSRHPGREVDPSTVVTKLEQDVLSWMGNMNYTAEVLHSPLVFVPVLKGLFLMPEYEDLYPLLESDVPKIAQFQLDLARSDKVKPVESLSEIEWQHLPLKMRVKIRQLVVNLHSLLQGMNAREEIFTIGHTAGIIGADLETYAPARQRRKVTSRKVSLVLVDRTLDLTTATCHQEFTLMDRILSLLPRLPGHKIDSAINMSPLCEVHPSCEWTLLPGCLSHTSNESASKAMNCLISKDKKTSLSFINKQVINAAKLAGFDVDQLKIENKFSSENVKSNIKLFTSDLEAFTKNTGLLQQGLGVVETLSHPRYSHLDQLVSLEKSFVQALRDDEETPPFTQILQLLRTRSGRNVSIEEVLTLLVHIASLAGPEALPPALHYSLTNILSQTILEDKNILSDSVLSLVGRDVDEISSLKTSQLITERLQAIAVARENLNVYKNIYEPSNGAEPAKVLPLLQSLTRDCLSIGHSECPDLDYKSVGLKDFIKSGIGLFVNVSKPMPRDAAVMIIMVIGGVTPGEVKMIQDSLNELHPQCEVIVASSHLTYPANAIYHALGANPLLSVL